MAGENPTYTIWLPEFYREYSVSSKVRAQAMRAPQVFSIIRTPILYTGRTSGVNRFVLKASVVGEERTNGIIIIKKKNR